jgi:hypothetical protein
MMVAVASSLNMEVSIIRAWIKALEKEPQNDTPGRLSYD